MKKSAQKAKKKNIRFARLCFAASVLRPGKRVPCCAYAGQADAGRVPCCAYAGQADAGRVPCCAYAGQAVRFRFAGYTQRSNSDAAESFRTAAGFFRRRRADFWHHSTLRRRWADVCHHSTTPPCGNCLYALWAGGWESSFTRGPKFEFCQKFLELL